VGAEEERADRDTALEAQAQDLAWVAVEWVEVAARESVEGVRVPAEEERAAVGLVAEGCGTREAAAVRAVGDLVEVADLGLVVPAAEDPALAADREVVESAGAGDSGQEAAPAEDPALATDREVALGVVVRVV
jgi:hypothetical protein